MICVFLQSESPYQRNDKYYCYWQIISRLSSLQKNLSSGFWNNAKFVGMDQITYTNCNNTSWMRANKIRFSRDRPEQFPSFFVRSYQWYQTTMRWSRVSKAYHFLKILAYFVDSLLFHCFHVSFARAQLAKNINLHLKELSITFRRNFRNMLIVGLYHGCSSDSRNSERHGPSCRIQNLYLSYSFCLL